jgi:16S rRNA (guanine527-N7)-methyltransferase
LTLVPAAAFRVCRLPYFFPEVQFHLVDSIGKKLKVIEAVKEAVGLPNLTTQHTRAEDIKDRKFDFAVSRAVAPLKDLWEWSKPLLKNPAFFSRKAACRAWCSRGLFA